MPNPGAYTRSWTLLPSAARTTHTNTAEFFAQGERNFRLDVDITAFSGTSITFTIQYYDSGKGDWLTLLASAAISATGHTTYTVGPDLATAANVSLQAVLPKRMRVVPSGTITSVTYSLMATMGD